MVRLRKEFPLKEKCQFRFQILKIKEEKYGMSGKWNMIQFLEHNNETN